MRRSLLLLAVGLLSAAPIQGQPLDCLRRPNVPSPKILLDGVYIDAEDNGPRARAFQERVRRLLWMRVSGLRELLTSEGVVNPVECRERVPSGPADIPAPVKKIMLDDGVLVEFWARVDSTSTYEDQPAFLAEVQWMSYPLYGWNDVQSADRGFFSTTTEWTNGESTRAVDSLLVPQRVLAAHVLLSFAIQDFSAARFRPDKYADAYRRMCDARSRLCASDSTLAKTLDGWMKLTLERAEAAGRPLRGVNVARINEEGGP